jgi:NifU-like protein involved in Fe-S cluster formation
VDESVIKYYRAILRAGFEHAGTLKDPEIALDAAMESIRICDHVGIDSLKIQIRITGNAIEDIRYMCTCDPTTNVAVEMLCKLLKGKSIDVLERLTPDDFVQELGSQSEELAKKAKGLLELAGKGAERYRAVSQPAQ